MDPTKMTDAEIVAAVREKRAALVPRGGDWTVGAFSLDDFEDVEGELGLIVVLTQEQCREVVAAFL